MIRPLLAAVVFYMAWFAASAQTGCGSVPAVFLGPDTVLCPGQSITLNAGTYDTYLWDNGMTTATRTVSQPTTCSVVVSGVGSNIIVNGDFELGNVGFTTSYGPGTGGFWGVLSNTGTYAITTSPNVVHTNFAVCADHTPAPGQNQLVVNGATVPNALVWCQNVAVQPNTDYQFGTWATSALTDPAVALLQFSINSVQLGAIFSPSATGCTWAQYTQTWNSGISTNAQICIVNQNTTGGGNDFALDDISFRPVCYHYDTLVVQYDSPFVDAGPDLVVCAQDTDTLGLAAAAGSTYQWLPATGIVGATDSSRLVVGGLSPVSALTVAYTLSMVDSFGCAASDQVDVTFKPPFPLGFAGGDVTVCANDTIQIGVAAQPGYTYHWSPGTGIVGADTLSQIQVGGLPGNPVVPTVTDYVLAVADADFCPGSDTVRVHFAPLRPAVFAVPDSLCVGQQGFVLFTGPDTAGVTCAWTFGGGNGGSTQGNGPIPVSWATPGIKTVGLTTTFAGCQHDSVKQVVVSAVPTADFVLAPDVCLHSNTPLTYTGTGGAGATLAWNFGGGDNSGTPAHPLVAWGAAGNTAVSLVVSENGCVSEPLVQEVEIHPLPVADFLFENACENSPVLFNSAATVAGSDVIVSRLWDFGSGGGAITPTALHTYNQAGTYPVTLSVTTAYGCTDDTTQTIAIYPTPLADFAWEDNCEHFDTRFTDLSVVSSGGVLVQWQWWFGNGYSDTSQHPAHRYQLHGGGDTYTVRLAVRTDQGCVDTAAKPVTINAVPVVAFAQEDVCLNEPMAFTDLSQLTQGGHTSRDHLAFWHWDFGDSTHSSSVQTHPQFVYAAPGNYTVVLTVGSDSGCVAAVSQQVQVFPPPPPPVAASDTACLGEAALLVTSMPDSLSIRWFETAAALEPIHTGAFLQTPPVVFPATYYLQTATPHGCESERVPVQAGVWPDAHVALTASAYNVEMPDSVLFTVSSAQPLIAYTWDFGDGMFSGSPAPTHAFAQAGFMTVRAFVTDTAGCSYVQEAVIEVKRRVTVVVPSVFTPNGDGDNDFFFIGSHNLAQLHLRIFDRWGHLFYETTEVDFRWDGTDGKGNPLPEGSYLYLLETTAFDGRLKQDKGTFLLVR